MSPFRMMYLSIAVLVLYCTQEAKAVIQIPFPVAHPKLIRGVVGDDLILPCYLKNNLSAVDMEVAWLIGSNSIVHKYKQHQDVTDRQLLQYHHRTSLFREELQRGNVSLKLTDVRLNDTNRYRCYVAGQHGSNEDALEVQVNKFGGDPVTSAEIHENGTLTLTCETADWSHTTTPTLEWRDSGGVVLQNISISYLMQARVTVQQTANNQHMQPTDNSYTCRVSYLSHKKEKTFDVHQFGGDPVTSAESNVNGSATLTCETPNWPHNTKPTLEWLDSEGVVLQNITVSCCSDCFSKTIFSMQAKVTVQEKVNNTYTCRVSYLDHKRQNRDPFKVHRRFFEKQRPWRWPLLVLFILAILILICLITRCRKNSRRRVLQRYRALSTDMPPKANRNPTDRSTDQTDGSTDTEPRRTTSKGLKKDIQKSENVDHYTKLLIVGGHREFRGGEESRRRDYQETSVEKLLTQDAHNLVILQGEDGYGKSSTAEKILHDWCSGIPYLKRYDLVFLLKCDELPSSPEQSSLLDIVSRQIKIKYKNLIEEIMNRSPQKILFVIDGLDELSLSEEDARESPSDPFTRAQSKALVGGLLSRRILSAASMLVTIRPSAAAIVEKLYSFRPWKFAQILGFKQEAVKEYCSRCFEENSPQLESLTSKPVLFASCFNPMLCWIICEAMKKKKDLNNSIVELGTATSVYVAFFGDFLKGLSTDQRNNLCTQAKKNVEAENVQLDLRDIPILEDGDPFRRSKSDQQRKPFIHRSFLEFFASLSYNMLDDKEAERQCEELLIAVNRELSPQSPCNSHIHIVLKFLFGLSNKDINCNVQNILEPPSSSSPSSSSSLSSSSCLLPQLKQWVLDSCSYSHNRENLLFLLQCLYELHDEHLVRESMKTMKEVKLSYTPLACTDCCVLQYCLTTCPSIKKLDLSQCNLTSEKLKLLEPAWETLQCDDLRLTAKGLNYTDIDDLMKRIFPSPSEQSEESQDKRGKTKISLQCVKSSLLGDEMKLLTEEKLPELLKISQSRNISCDVSIEVDRCTEGGGVYLSFSAETSDIFQLNVQFWKPESRDGQRAEVLSISLTLPSSQFSETVWKDFLQKTHRLRRDRSVVQHLCSLPELRKLDIQVTCLKVDWAADILSCLHGCTSLQELMINDDRSTLGHCGFSCITLKRDNGIRVSVKDSSDEQIAFIILPTTEVSTPEQSTQLFTMICRLKNREDQEESVRALLSKQVSEAKLLVNCITVSLAEMVLSFDKDISVFIWTKNYGEQGNICSQFKVKKEESHFELLVKEDKVSSSVYTAPVLSDMHLKSEKSPVDMKWGHFLTLIQTLNTLKNSDPAVDVHVDELLYSWYGQQGLKELDLCVSSLSDSQKDKLQQAVLSGWIQSVRVLQGYNSLLGNDVKWEGEGKPKNREGWTWRFGKPKM